MFLPKTINRNKVNHKSSLLCSLTILYNYNCRGFSFHHPSPAFLANSLGASSASQWKTTCFEGFLRSYKTWTWDTLHFGKTPSPDFNETPQYSKQEFIQVCMNKQENGNNWALMIGSFAMFFCKPIYRFSPARGHSARFILLRRFTVGRFILRNHRGGLSTPIPIESPQVWWKFPRNICARVDQL